MTVSAATRRQIHPLFLFLIGFLCLGIATFLLALHAETVRTIEDGTVPLVSRIPQLERRIHVIQEQVELASLQASLRTGSQEEQIHMYVLPKGTDIDRTLSLLETLFDDLEFRGDLASVSPVTVGDSSAEDTLVRRPLTFQASVRGDGLGDLLTMVHAAGMLTVADILTADQLKALLDFTADENPSSILALEQFLSTDLLRYAQDPRVMEERLLQSFSLRGSFAAVFRATKQESALADLERLLGGTFGDDLRAASLWPLPFLTLDSLEIERGNAAGWYRASFSLTAYGR